MMGFNGRAFQIAQDLQWLGKAPTGAGRHRDQKVQANCLRETVKEVWESNGTWLHGSVCVCTCTRMCLHRTQWGNPRSKASYQTDWVSKPSYWLLDQCAPATGVGLQPQELVHPDASNWGDQGIQRQLLEGLCVCAQLLGGSPFCTRTYFPLTDLHYDH